MSAITKSKEFNKNKSVQTDVDKQPKNNITLHHSQHVDTVTVHNHQGSAQHMARHAQTAARLVISAQYAEARKPGQ